MWTIDHNLCGMNKKTIISILLFVVGTFLSRIVAYDALCNPNATPAAKQVYQILRDQYGQKTISGTVARVDWNIDEAEYVHAWTGQYPALNVFDFINIHASKDVNPNGWLNYSDMSVVTNWWNNGGIVGCMWHWQVRANNGVNYTCSPGNEPGETDFDASCINNPQSDDYRQLLHDIDQVAGYLKTMQEKGIAVIWRPLHEAAGNTFNYVGGKAWFWWGAKGGEACKALWRFMYDRMVNYHGLNNLIWVWTAQGGDRDWYPGDDVVDIVSLDSYHIQSYAITQQYLQLQRDYPNKIIALSECGNSEDQAMDYFSQLWSQGSRWSWFMTWYDYHYTWGSDLHRFAGKQWWQDAVNSGKVIMRSEMQQLRLSTEVNPPDNPNSTHTLDLADLNNGWGTSYDTNTHTITFHNAWGGRGWWLEQDMSDYCRVIVVFDYAPCPGQLVVEYGNGTDASSTMFYTGDNSVEVLLNDYGKSNVTKIYLQCAEANAQLHLHGAYLIACTPAGTDVIIAPSADPYYYTLQGIPTLYPQSQQLYIHKGKKIIIP